MVLNAFTMTRQHGPSSCYVERQSFENLSVLMDDKKIKHDMYVGNNDVGITVPSLSTSPESRHSILTVSLNSS